MTCRVIKLAVFAPPLSGHLYPVLGLMQPLLDNPNYDITLNNLPRHVLNLGADWKSAPALRLWAKARYRSKTLEPGKSQLPGYAMFDMGASYEVNPAMRLAAGLYNVASVDRKSVV